MIFTPHLAALVMCDEKTVTRRRMSPNPRSPWSSAGCALVVGQAYAVQPGRSKESLGRIRIIRIDEVRLGDMTNDEAELEGFRNVEDFEATWMNINGGWDADERVWRVEFERVRDEEVTDG